MIITLNEDEVKEACAQYAAALLNDFYGVSKADVEIVNDCGQLIDFEANVDFPEEPIAEHVED